MIQGYTRAQNIPPKLAPDRKDTFLVLGLARGIQVSISVLKSFQKLSRSTGGISCEGSSGLRFSA